MGSKSFGSLTPEDLVSALSRLDPRRGVVGGLGELEGSRD